MKRALVIEDDENSIVLETEMLLIGGFQVSQARSGQEGIALAQREKPDVILMDIGLPDMDGIAALAEIRNLPDRSDTPVVAMTSYAMSGDRDRFLNAGFNEYIEKPIDPQKALTMILDLFSNKS